MLERCSGSRCLAATGSLSCCSQCPGSTQRLSGWRGGTRSERGAILGEGFCVVPTPCRAVSGKPVGGPSVLLNCDLVCAGKREGSVSGLRGCWLHAMGTQRLSRSLYMCMCTVFELHTVVSRTAFNCGKCMRGQLLSHVPMQATAGTCALPPDTAPLPQQHCTPSGSPHMLIAY